MSTKQFIDQLIAGDNAEAKETIENVLSAKAFEALDAYKKAMATSIFSTASETVEEEVKLDGEQLDEISKGLAARAYHKMANDGNDMKDRTGLAGDQSDRLRARMNKRWGEKAATRAINKADKDAYK